MIRTQTVNLLRWDPPRRGRTMTDGNGGRLMDNITLARRLTAHADALGERGAGLFRRRAFRKAAEVLLRLDRPAADILTAGGRKALALLPGIGRSIADAIDQLIRT